LNHVFDKPNKPSGGTNEIHSSCLRNRKNFIMYHSRFTLRML